MKRSALNSVGVLAASLSVWSVAQPAFAQASVDTAQPQTNTSPAVPTPSPAAGPTSPQTTSPQAASSGSSRPPIAEIVVTAQKRSENLQRVPIAVTALTSAQLAKNQTITTRDLQFSTPALVYNQAANNAQPFLRGIGSDLFGPNLDASTATYIDGVYVSAGQGIVTALLGVDRVEVLEGPQGTLFGRNAVGGAISVYTLTPGDETAARFSLTGGNYDHAGASGYLSGPVTDRLSIGVYGLYDYRHTFHDIPQDALTDAERREGIRGKLVWKPLDGIKLTGSAEYTHTITTEAGALRNIEPGALGYLVGATPVIANDYYSSDTPQGTRIRSQAYTLREEGDLGFADLVGITGYRKLNTTTVNDLDGTNAPLLADYAKLYSQQFSQEVQLLSKPGSPITWILGGYFFREKTGYDPVSIFSDIAYLPATFTADQVNAQVITHSYAAFGQATGKLLDGLRLTVGLRFTHDEKSYVADEHFTTGTGMEGPGTDVIAPVIYPIDHAHWNKFTPKVTLDYTLGRTLLYATFSQGFKGGAYNVATPSAAGPVKPENLTAYEGGVKSTFANGHVRLNGSVYYYDFKDLQIQLVGSNGQTQLQNAAKGHAYGVEGALILAPLTGLTLSGSISLERTKYTDFPNYASYAIGPAGNPGQSFDVTGNQLIRAPKVASNVSADYTYRLAKGGSIDANAKWYYNGGYYWEATNRFRQNAYSLVNLSLGYTLPGDKVSITGFVSNLLNTRYQTSLLVLPVSISVSDGEPRMYGLTLGWKL